MAYLADTHIVLWAMDEFEKLTPTQREILESDAEVLVSVASIWEMAIKASIGKLEIPQPITPLLLDMGFQIFPITPDHVEATRTLPLHHRDPFDRLLIAQAQLESLTLLSADKRLEQYGVKVV